VTLRVYRYALKPAAEAIVATLRIELSPAASEERRSPHETILRAAVADPDETLDRLTATLERYHPFWRRHVKLDRVA
jgi:hypothetical protein